MAIDEKARRRREELERVRQENIEKSKKQQGTPAENTPEGTRIFSRPTGTPASQNQEITNLPNQQAAQVQLKNAQQGLAIRAAGEKQQQTQQTQEFLQGALNQPAVNTATQPAQNLPAQNAQVVGFREQTITDELGNQQQVKVPVTEQELNQELGGILSTAALGIGASPAAAGKLISLGKGADIAVSAEKANQAQAVLKIKDLMKSKLSKVITGGVATGAAFFSINKFLNSPKTRINSLSQKTEATGELVNQIVQTGINTGDVTTSIQQLQELSDSVQQDEQEILYLRSKSLDMFSNPEFADAALIKTRKIKLAIQNAQFILAQQGASGQATDPQTLAILYSQLKDNQ